MSDLTIIETGEVVATMPRVEAERVTARIADLLDGIADNVELVMPLMRDAMTRKAWDALDYDSPTTYLRDRFTGALTRLPVELRRSVVTELSASGMSTRAIAPVVGVTQQQVQRDTRAQVTHDVSPEPAPTPTPTRTFTDNPGKVQPITGPATNDWGLPKSDKIVGTDGKTYTRPEPAEVPKPKRKPLAEQAQTAEWELVRAIERIEGIVNDDRFTANKEVVAPHLRGHLNNAIEACQGLLNRINL